MKAYSLGAYIPVPQILDPFTYLLGSLQSGSLEFRAILKPFYEILHSGDYSHQI